MRSFDLIILQILTIDLPLADFIDSFLMSATLENRAQPGIDYLDPCLHGNHPAADGNHIGVIVLFGEPGACHVPADAATDSRDLVGHHRFTVAAAAKDYPQVTVASCHTLGGGPAIIGIIDRLQAVGAKIDNPIPGLLQMGFDRFFQGIAGMIRSQCYFPHNSLPVLMDDAP
jgi:hypothetical protein